MFNIQLFQLNEVLQCYRKYHKLIFGYIYCPYSWSKSHHLNRNLDKVQTKNYWMPAHSHLLLLKSIKSKKISLKETFLLERLSFIAFLTDSVLEILFYNMWTNYTRHKFIRRLRIYIFEVTLNEVPCNCACVYVFSGVMLIRSRTKGFRQLGGPTRKTGLMGEKNVDGKNAA